MDSGYTIRNCCCKNCCCRHFQILIRSLFKMKSLHLLSRFHGCIFNVSREKWIRKLPPEILCADLKGQLHSKNKFSSNEERETCKKNEPSPTSMRQMVLEISHSKFRNLSKMEVAILKVLSVIFTQNDVTDANLQDNAKMKVWYRESLLFNVFEISQAVKTWQRNFAQFKISLLWQTKSTQFSSLKKQKLYYLSGSVF